jgi:hypothetical protein
MLNNDFLISCASIDIASEKDFMLYFCRKDLPEAEKPDRDKKDGARIFQGLVPCFVKKYLYNNAGRGICKFSHIANFRRFEIRLDLENKRQSECEKEQGNTEN